MNFKYLPDYLRDATPERRLVLEARFLGSDASPLSYYWRDFAPAADRFAVEAYSNPIARGPWVIDGPRLESGQCDVYPAQGPNGLRGYRKILRPNNWSAPMRHRLASELLASRLATHVRLPVAPAKALVNENGMHELVTIAPFSSPRNIEQAGGILTAAHKKSLAITLSAMHPFYIWLFTEGINAGGLVCAAEARPVNSWGCLDFEDSRLFACLGKQNKESSNEFTSLSRQQAGTLQFALNRYARDELGHSSDAALGHHFLASISAIEKIGAHIFHDILATMPPGLLEDAEKQALFEMLLARQPLLRPALTDNVSLDLGCTTISQPAIVAIPITWPVEEPIAALDKMQQELRPLAREISALVKNEDYHGAFTLFQEAMREICVKQKQPARADVLHNLIFESDIAVIPYLWDEEGGVAAAAFIYPWKDEYITPLTPDRDRYLIAAVDTTTGDPWPEKDYFTHGMDLSMSLNASLHLKEVRGAYHDGTQEVFRKAQVPVAPVSMHRFIDDAVVEVRL